MCCCHEFGRQCRAMIQDAGSSGKTSSWRLPCIEVSSCSIKKGIVPLGWQIRVFLLKRLAVCKRDMETCTSATFLPFPCPGRPSTMAPSLSNWMWYTSTLVLNTPSTSSTSRLCKWFAGAACHRAVRLVKIGLQLQWLTLTYHSDKLMNERDMQSGGKM